MSTSRRSPRATPAGAEAFLEDGERDQDAPRLRADAQRNRERVVKAAIEAFSAEGLAVSMGSIARRAKVGVGTIYRQFPTKEALYRAVVRRELEQLFDRARQLAKSEDPVAALFTFLDLVLDVAAAKRELVETFERIKGESRDIEAAWKQSLGLLVKRAQRSGGVRNDVGVDDVLALLGGACAAVTHHRTDAAARERLASIVCDGLRATGSTRPASKAT